VDLVWAVQLPSQLQGVGRFIGFSILVSFVCHLLLLLFLEIVRKVLFGLRLILGVYLLALNGYFQLLAVHGVELLFNFNFVSL
jgi:hypothetical protein